MKKEGVDLDPPSCPASRTDSAAANFFSPTNKPGRARSFLRHDEEEAGSPARCRRGTQSKRRPGFSRRNKAKPAVVTLPSGLQYKVISAGTGPKPTAEDTSCANYRGTLLNGTEFDNSAKHGGATEIPVGGVIKGFGPKRFQLMPAGSKWELYVPAELAYGPRPAGPDIGPNSTLIFQVELVSIQPKKETPKPERSRRSQRRA